jgi:hypothetical protein
MFVDGLNRRLRPLWRCQLTTDGFKPYIDAVEAAFGADVDYAQLVKVMGKPDNAGPDWYGPAKVIEVVPNQDRRRTRRVMHLHQPRREGQPQLQDATTALHAPCPGVQQEAAQSEG